MDLRDFTQSLVSDFLKQYNTRLTAEMAAII